MVPRYVIIMRFPVISQTDLFPEVKAASRGKSAASNDEIENERVREVPARNERPEAVGIYSIAVLSARLVTKTESLSLNFAQWAENGPNSTLLTSHPCIL